MKAKGIPPNKLQKILLENIQKGKLNGLGLRAITRFVGESHPQRVKHHLLALKNKGRIVFNIELKTYKPNKKHKHVWLCAYCNFPKV